MYSGEFWVTFLSQLGPAQYEHLGLAVQIIADVEHLWRRHLAQPNPLAPWCLTHLTRNTNSLAFQNCTANLTSPTLVSSHVQDMCSAPPNPSKIGSHLQQNSSKNDRRKMHVSYLYCKQYIYIHLYIYISILANVKPFDTPFLLTSVAPRWLLCPPSLESAERNGRTLATWMNPVGMESQDTREFHTPSLLGGTFFIPKILPSFLVKNCLSSPKL